MKPDFQGWATKYGVECADGKTIKHGAFEDQDQKKVPLVWQHGHGDPEMVLGHAILEKRDEGIYAYGYFNGTPKAQHAKDMVLHGDVNQLSIWANKLVQRANQVFHGVLREVSLVLAGANPEARIESVTIAHADGGYSESEDEAIIHTGLEFVLSHTEGEEEEVSEEEAPAEEPAEEEVVTEEVSEEEADADDEEDEVEHADDDTVAEIYEAMSDDQKTVVHYLVGQALEASASEDDGDSVAQDDMKETSEEKETDEMKHNLFEQGKADDTDDAGETLSHAQVEEIMEMAHKTNTSLRSAVTAYGVQHGITSIETMFPDAQATSATPEWHKRRTEWVQSLVGSCKKVPFSRIKTLFADITEDEARAKGYIKGNLKKEEFFSVSKRTTTPQTIYKKQKLDRDDIIDITDFDVVTWLKGEMRLMLDEEIARAILVGDGRDVASDDKIQETNIRPIATDHDLYTVKVRANIEDANSSAQEIIDTVILNRHQYKGSGSPLFFCSESVIATFLVLKDGFDRPMYKDLAEVAQALRVSRIVPTEILEEYPTIAGIMVNPMDYSIGTDAGGQVTMFDDFDIDYNQNKYLIETRMSGALTKLKSAMVVELVPQSVTLVEPDFSNLSFVAATGQLTVTDQTGIVFKDASDDSVLNAAGSPYTVTSGETLSVYAEADTGYALADSEDNTETYTAD